MDANPPCAAVLPRPTKPQSRSVALHPAWAVVWTLAAKTTAAPWSSVSLCPSVLWFVLSWAPSCLQAWGSSLQEPSFSFSNTAPGPLLYQKKKTTPRQSGKIPCCFLPPSPKHAHIRSSFFPFSLVCTREVWEVVQGRFEGLPPSCSRTQSLSWITFCFSTLSLWLPHPVPLSGLLPYSYRRVSPVLGDHTTSQMLL